MFKFNFDAADDGAGGGGGGNEAIPQLPAKEENFSHLDPEEFLDEMASDALFEPIEIDDDLAIKRCRLPASETLGALADVVENSDLAPGVYEGGFKVWEGSVDLVRHLKKNNVEMQGKRVIELGCGHGLPGIYAAMQVISSNAKRESAVQSELKMTSVSLFFSPAPYPLPPCFSLSLSLFLFLSLFPSPFLSPLLSIRMYVCMYVCMHMYV